MAYLVKRRNIDAGLFFFFLLTMSLLILCSASFVVAGLPDVLREEFPVVNAPVESIVYSLDGQTIYIGGSFTRVGPSFGNGAAISLSTGAGLLSYPKVYGEINAVVSDGYGGWYIGGKFAKVGDFSVQNIAHILPSGVVDPNFNPNIGDTADVRALYLDQTSHRLYVGGQFFSVNGQNRRGAISIDLISGQPTSWNPNLFGELSGPVHVNAFVLDEGTNVLYLGGLFSGVGNVEKRGLVGVDPVTGQLVRPNLVALDEWGFVNALIIDSTTNTLYAGGYFDSIGGQLRTKLASIDLATGQLHSWSPSFTGGSTVRSLALNPNNNELYVGGLFHLVNGLLRNNLVSFNVVDGQPTSWNPSLNADVNSVVFDAFNNVLYIGGSFTKSGVHSRPGLAAFNTITRELTSWNPDSSLSIDVVAIDAQTATAYVGSVNPLIIGGVVRNGLAAFDVQTGQLTDWDPNVRVLPLGVAGPGFTNRATVKSMYIYPLNNHLYIGGYFNSVGGQTRRGVAAVDLATGQATSFNANIVYDMDISPVISSIASDYGFANPPNTLYVGGLFSRVGGLPRRYLAAVDIETGAFSADWNPEVLPYNVQSLASDPKTGVLYVGGRFRSIDGEPRFGLAAVFLSNGELVSWWNPISQSVYFHGDIDHVDYHHGTSTLYASGSIPLHSDVPDFPHNHLQTRVGGFYGTALGESSGVPVPWNPAIMGTPHSMSIDEGYHKLFVSRGHPNYHNTSNYLVYDLFSMEQELWTPVFYRHDGVSIALNAFVGDFLSDSFAVGGSFHTVNGDFRENFAVFTAPSGNVICHADFDANHSLDANDVFAFLIQWFAYNVVADYDNNGLIQVSDISKYIGAWLAGC